MIDEKGSKWAMPDGFDSCPDYWTAQETPWRTEPEIDEERQKYLDMRRSVTPNIEKSMGTSS